MDMNTESKMVAEYAIEIVLDQVWRVIDAKTSGDCGDTGGTGTCAAGRPKIRGRPVPSPLQVEETSAPPPEQSPEAMAPQLWPQTPQSPLAPPCAMPNTQDSFNAGFAAGFRGAFSHGFPDPNPAAFGGATMPNFGPVAFTQMGNTFASAHLGGTCAPSFTNNYTNYNVVYPSYHPPHGFSMWQNGWNYGGPVNSGQSMGLRHPYYPQTSSQAQCGQEGQAFFQPFSTQPPAHPAMQHFAPPPAAPGYAAPHLGSNGLAPLTAQFSPLLNTQPFQQLAALHPQPPMQPPAAPPAVTIVKTQAHHTPPAPPAPTPPPTVPPPAPPLMPDVAAPPARKATVEIPATAQTKEQRRKAAEEVLLQQRAWVASLARGPENTDTESDTSTTVSAPSESKPIDAATLAHHSKTIEAEAVSQAASKTEPKEVPKTTSWAPKIAGGVWVAKDNGKGMGKGSHKGIKGNKVGKGAKGNKGGKGSMVYMPKNEGAENPARWPKRRGKMAIYYEGH